MQNLLRRWRAIWNPDMYHGWGKQHTYFEGWYIKIVDPTEQYAFACIPGISRGLDGRHHSFIQLLDGKQCTAQYHNFSVEVFQPSEQRFEVAIEKNSFSAQRIVLDLPELSGELRFHHLHPWPKMLGAPGVMGWYSFVPFMECYHGVVSMHHELEGRLRVKGKEVDFTTGRGYIEKDCGRSFPNSWIWMQTNHFEAAEEPISFMASVAKIPWLGNFFIGYLVGFLWRGKLYRFATYTGAMMKATLGERSVQLAFKDGTHRLEILAHQGKGGELVSPISGNMAGKVNESMQASIEISFYEKEHLLFSGIGRNAGLEVAGSVHELITEKWRR